MIRFTKIQLIFILLSGVVLLFIVAPIIGLYLHTSGSQWSDSLHDKEIVQSVGRTLFISFLATLGAAVFVIPFAYLLAKKNFTGKVLVNALIDLPVIIPHSAAGIALLGLVSRGSLLGDFAEKIGFSFIGHPAGIALAMAFVSIPFLINASRDGFAQVPERLEKAAANLGSSPFRVFFTVSLPLAKQSIFSGLILMFGRGMSEFGAVIIIAYQPFITPVLIYERFTAYGLEYSRPVAALFVLVCVLVFIALRLVGRNKS